MSCDVAKQRMHISQLTYESDQSEWEDEDGKAFDNFHFEAEETGEGFM